MAKRNTKNQNTQTENLLTIGLYYTFLRRIAVDAWTFEGLPFDDDDVYRHANNILNENFVLGKLGGLWKENDFYVVGDCVASSSRTWYGGSTMYQCKTFVNVVSKDLNEVATLTASLSPFADYDIVSIDGLCRHYAALLYECDRCINVNLKAQNTPAILNAPDGQELTFANMYEEIAGHKPVVYTRDMSPLKSQYDDIRQIVYQTPAPFVAGNVEQLKSMLMSDFMFMLGVNGRTQSKVAQVSSLEVMQDAPTLMVLRNSYEQARQNFCDQCNKKFGLNVTATFNDSNIGDVGLLDQFSVMDTNRETVKEVKNSGLEAQESEGEDNDNSND
jgi:hypothetical protein|nr:MAG TPA: upper collar protein [Caudoviricetes sp.]